MASLSAALKTGLITFNLHRRIIWSAAQSTQFLQKWRHVHVRELRGSFKLLVHVLMWEITWEETAVNHQSTEWHVALACFFFARLNFPMSDNRVMLCKSSPDMHLCFCVCLFPGVCKVAWQRRRCLRLCVNERLNLCSCSKDEHKSWG